MKAQGATLVGSVVGGVLASVCCIGPLVFALLGISGAALAHRFEPFRPYFLVLTYGLLGAAFYLSYRPAKAECGPGGACEMPRANRGGKVVLWIAAVVVVLTTAFPVVLTTAFPLYSVYLYLRGTMMTMNKAWSILFAAVFALASAASAGEVAKTTLTVKGMTCGGCVAAVKVQLKKTEGVTAYDVSLEKGEAGVSYDAAKTTPEKIAASVSKTGFETSLKSSGEKKEK